MDVLQKVFQLSVLSNGIKMPFVLPADGESIQGILSHQQTSRRPVHLDPEKNSGQTSVIGILKGCLVRCAVIACRKVGRARKSKQICPLLAVSAMEVRIPDWDNLSLTLSPCMLDFIFSRNDTSPGHWTCSIRKLPGGKNLVGRSDGSWPKLDSTILSHASSLLAPSL